MSEALVHGPAAARSTATPLGVIEGGGSAQREGAEEPRGLQAPRGAYIPTLDGWRAIAVGLVVFSHWPVPHALWRDLVGTTGVSIFFGISGFLICTRLLEEEKRAGAIGLRRFYVRRAFRILPPAFAYLAVVLVFGGLHLLTLTPLEIAGSTFFFRNYVPGNWYTSHFWSLAVEEHFYLFFPALLIALGRRRTAWAALGLSLAGAVWRITDNRFGLLSKHLPDGVFPAARTDYRLDGLLLACLAAILVFEKTPRVPRSAVLVIPWVGAVLLGGAVAGVVPLPEFVKAAVIVLMLMATAWTPGSLLSRVLETAPLRWAGRLSYSLYLWQQFFFVKFAGNAIPALHPLQSWPGSMAALFGMACASYYLLERPMLKIGHRLGKSPVPGR